MSVSFVCLTVFVNCLVKQLAMCVGVVAILLLNVMEVFSVTMSLSLSLCAVLYVRVSCFVVRGCGVSRRYIDVCYCDMFSVVNV